MNYGILYLVIINVVVFMLFGKDKYNARWKLRRVPEKTLLGLALAGGSIGALAGMIRYRHKIRKPKFSIGLPAILILHIAVALCFVFLFKI